MLALGSEAGPLEALSGSGSGPLEALSGSGSGPDPLQAYLWRVLYRVTQLNFFFYLVATS